MKELLNRLRRLRPPSRECRATYNLAPVFILSVVFVGCVRGDDAAENQKLSEGLPRDAAATESTFESIIEHEVVFVSEPSAFVVEFKVPNTSSGTMEIVNTTTTCGCMVAEIDEKVIAPGLAAKLRIRTTTGYVFEPTTRRGTCTLTFGSGETRRYTAVAPLVPKVAMPREGFLFRKLRDGNDGNRDIAVRLFGKEEKFSAALAEIAGLPNGMHWKWIAAPGRALEYASGVWERQGTLQLGFDEDAPFVPLRYDALATFSFDGVAEQVEIPFVVDLIRPSMVCATPARIVFGQCDGTDEPFRTVQVRLERLDGRPLSLARYNTQHAFVTVFETQSTDSNQLGSENIRQLTLELNASLVDRTTVGACEIRFSDPDLASITIPYSVIRKAH